MIMAFRKRVWPTETELQAEPCEHCRDGVRRYKRIVGWVAGALLALGVCVAATGCSTLPQGRGATLAAIDDRLEPVAQGLDALSLLVETFRTTLRGAEAAATQASSRTAALEVSVERAQTRAATAERDIRGARDELRDMARELGAIDPEAIADGGVTLLEAVAGGTGGAAGLASVLGALRMLFRREQRKAREEEARNAYRPVDPARAGPGGGPVE